MEQRIKIKHPGARGWAGIAASAFDPNKHELYDAAPVERPATVPTRDDIDKMGKPDLIEWLEAHGAEFDKRIGVDKLRDLLARVMFVGI